MQHERTDETETHEILPKWNGLYQMPISPWRDGIEPYEKSYFLDPMPSLISEKSTSVRIRQDDGGKFHYIIQLNAELTSFLDSLERNIYFHSVIYSQQIMKVNMSTYDQKLYINTKTQPAIFDGEKRQIHPMLPMEITAKLNLVATCLSRKKNTHSYHVFYDVKQLLLSNECVWS